jgi:hypothetical protein
MNELNAEDGYNDPLQWWKKKHVQYSYVWKFAHRVLCISALSAPSEPVFSCGGNIVTNKGSRLTTDTVNVLVTLKAQREF